MSLELDIKLKGLNSILKNGAEIVQASVATGFKDREFLSKPKIEKLEKEHPGRGKNKKIKK